MKKFFLKTTFFSILGSIATAHELWLEPASIPLVTGDTVEVSVFVGEEFIGEEIANFPHMQDVVDLFVGDQRYGISTRIGDLPAFRFRAESAGLHVMRYQSVNNPLSYANLAEFEDFLEEVRQTYLLQEHLDRGFPQQNIEEIFVRYAKTLIGVDGGNGSDVLTGMQLELLALDNPYMSGSPVVTYQLFENGEPLPSFPVYVLIRSLDGSVERRELFSDAVGQFDVSVLGSGLYMVNAVQVIPRTENMPEGAWHWQSRWASSTFWRY